MNPSKSRVVLLGLLLVLLGVSTLDGQWVAAAHAVKNRIQQLSQKSGDAGYDVAIVVLEAEPARVYDKTLKSLQAHPEITITKDDGKTGKIEFRKGQQIAGFQITALGDKLTQLVIAASAGVKGEPSPTSLVLDAVLRVCKEVDVKCTVEPN
jgi:hypothetical protein